MSTRHFPPGVPPGVPDPFPHVKRAYISAEEQLERWVRGEAVHRHARVTKCGVTHEIEECTPDFACCQPQLLAEPIIRNAYAAASQRERLRFLSIFLNAMLAVVLPGKRAYVTGEGGHAS